MGNTPVSNLRRQTLGPGEEAVLHCQYAARGGAANSWLKDGLPVEVAGSGRFSMQGSNLYIREVSQADTGLYTCLVQVDFCR